MMPKRFAPKHSEPSPAVPPSRPSPAHMRVTRPIVVQILLARLESNKSFDWYDLSLQLNQGKAATKDKKKGGKKWKEEGEEEGALTGNELRNMYNEVILPSLRRGCMPWEDNASEASTPPPTTPDHTTVTTPPAQMKRKTPARSEKRSEAKAKKVKMQERIDRIVDGVMNSEEEEEGMDDDAMESEEEM